MKGQDMLPISSISTLLAILIVARTPLFVIIEILMRLFLIIVYSWTATRPIKGLENRFGAIQQEFESLTLRHNLSENRCVATVFGTFKVEKVG